MLLIIVHFLGLAFELYRSPKRSHYHDLMKNRYTLSVPHNMCAANRSSRLTDFLPNVVPPIVKVSIDLVTLRICQ